VKVSPTLEQTACLGRREIAARREQFTINGHDDDQGEWHNRPDQEGIFRCDGYFAVQDYKSIGSKKF
jgi:hypothetical protein